MDETRSKSLLRIANQKISRYFFSCLPGEKKKTCKSTMSGTQEQSAVNAFSNDGWSPILSSIPTFYSQVVSLNSL